MIRALYIGQNRELGNIISWPEIEEWFKNNTYILWLDLVDPQQNDYEKLMQIFEINETILKETRESELNSQIKEYAECLYICTHYWQPQNPKNLPEIYFLLLEQTVITIRNSHFPELDVYWSNLAHRIFDGPVTEEIIVYNVLDAAADSFQNEIDLMEARIEDLEEQIIMDDIEGVLNEITQIRRKLIDSRRQLSIEAKITNKLLHPDLDYFAKRDRSYLLDINERYERVLKLAENNKERLGSLLDMYLSVLSNRANITSSRQNIIMQRLTVITAIFLPLTLIAGVYGMNFIYMPELNIHYGYFIVLGSMTVIGIGLYIYFKRIGWID